MTVGLANLIVHNGLGAVETAMLGGHSRRVRAGNGSLLTSKAVFRKSIAVFLISIGAFLVRFGRGV